VTERKAFLLRLDPEVFKALQRWSDDDLRSVNAQVEWILRKALRDAGRLRERKPPGGTGAGATSAT
jgi:hypothetical protein